MGRAQHSSRRQESRKGWQGAALTVTVIGVHVEVWNLPAVDAGICPTAVTVLTVAAHGYCQHRTPGWHRWVEEQGKRVKAFPD